MLIDIMSNLLFHEGVPMKARIISHLNPAYINMVCDVIYYDYDEEASTVIFKSYHQGQPLELPVTNVRIFFENLNEREQLERYMFEKFFECLWAK